ncbi:hypothetical protein ROLI_040250 [Roseobacter fucihabitans]|uniref:Toxin CcdB n=1 Tax=Roseobacter fucihabitans TaxID=1537242 RepID=A0ABZ2BZY5_9RHOB|nr:CcdB family protein [Roseobacter litoralis]MBC6964873.1 CcdB protein [Roseobacter litoralis]
MKTTIFMLNAQFSTFYNIYVSRLICLAYPGSDSDTLLLDVQADLLDALNTRMIVPLIAISKAPVPAKRLNPGS